MGYRPASERAIAATERRLGVPLPPSLKNFYRVTNGWRATGYSIFGIRPVSKIDWISTANPALHKIACEAEIPQPGEAAHMHPYRFGQGTRVKRSLVISTCGDAATWLLDPETRDAGGEWAAGMWASWSPGMEWTAASFAELMRNEAESFLRLRDGKPVDRGVTADQAKQNLVTGDRSAQLVGVLALQGSKDSRDGDDLFRTYQDRSADPLVREMAIEAACRLKNRAAYEQAIRDVPAAIAADENRTSLDHGGNEVRPYALFGAILAFGENADRVFAQWIDAESSRLRGMAIGALGKCRGSSIAREKLVHLLRAKDPEQRKVATYALGQLMDRTTIPALIAALEDSVPDVRCGALQCLLHVGATEAVPAIETLTGREKDPEVLAKIDFVLPALKPRVRKKRS